MEIAKVMNISYLIGTILVITYLINGITAMATKTAGSNSVNDGHRTSLLQIKSDSIPLTETHAVLKRSNSISPFYGNAVAGGGIGGGNGWNGFNNEWAQSPNIVETVGFQAWNGHRPAGPSPMEVANAIASAKQASANVLIAQQQVQAAKENVLNQQRLATEKETHASILTQKSEAAAAIQRSEAAAAAQSVILAQQRLASAKNIVAQQQRIASAKEAHAAAALHSSAHAAAAEIQRTEHEAAKIASVQRSNSAAASHHVAATKDAIINSLHAGNNHIQNVPLGLYTSYNNGYHFGGNGVGGGGGSSLATPVVAAAAAAAATSAGTSTPWATYSSSPSFSGGGGSGVISAAEWPTAGSVYGQHLKPAFNVWG